jgi:hypothetical protein
MLLSTLEFTLAGCGTNAGPPGAPPPVKDIVIGPHGGSMVRFKERGFVEVVREYGDSGPSSKSTSTKPRLVAYFYSTDGNTPLSASAVSIAYTTLEAPNPTSTGLKIMNDPKKPGVSYCFASEPGSFDSDEMRGELTATVEGETITVPWMFGPQ